MFAKGMNTLLTGALWIIPKQMAFLNLQPFTSYRQCSNAFQVRCVVITIHKTFPQKSYGDRILKSGSHLPICQSYDKCSVFFDSLYIKSLIILKNAAIFQRSHNFLYKQLFIVHSRRCYIITRWFCKMWHDLQTTVYMQTTRVCTHLLVLTSNKTVHVGISKQHTHTTETNIIVNTQLAEFSNTKTVTVYNIHVCVIVCINILSTAVHILLKISIPLAQLVQKTCTSQVWGKRVCLSVQHNAA